MPNNSSMKIDYPEKCHNLNLFCQFDIIGDIYSSAGINLCFFRFQILRELIPNSDQKRDTASFLLEVCLNVYTCSKSQLLKLPPDLCCLFAGDRVRTVLAGKGSKV